MVNVLLFANGTLDYQESRIPSGFIILHQLEVDGSSLLLKELIAVFVALVACQRYHQLSPLRGSPDEPDDVMQLAHCSPFPPKSKLTLFNLESRLGEGFSLKRVRVFPPEERSSCKADNMPKAPCSMVSNILLGHRRRKLTIEAGLGCVIGRDSVADTRANPISYPVLAEDVIYCRCLVISGMSSPHTAQGKKSRLDLIGGVEIVSVEAKESVPVWRSPHVKAKPNPCDCLLQLTRYCSLLYLE
jgi:hypothetical protein